MFVRLLSGWVDPAGVEHAAGAVVEVDAVTAAELRAAGVAEETPPAPRTSGEPGCWGGPVGYAQDDIVVVRDDTTGATGPTTGNGRD